MGRLICVDQVKRKEGNFISMERLFVMSIVSALLISMNDIFNSNGLIYVKRELGRV